MTDRPPLLTGGARRRRYGLRRAVLAVVLVSIAVLVVVVASPFTDGNGGKQASSVQRHDSRRSSKLLDAAAPPQALASGGGESRFAVKLATPDTVKKTFVRKPRAGLLFDVSTGRVLWRLNPTRRLAIASLTKMMTALVVTERRGPHDRVPITKQAVHTAGSAVGVLPKGKRVQLEALLNGLLLVSGNDAAVALAQDTGGSIAGFVRMMNERVRQLGLSCTRFSSPHGLADKGNHSCAVDLATLARADLHVRRIRRIVGRQRAIVKFPIKGGKLFLYNNNPLMRSGYRGVTGLKTGYTDRAGRSIVATARRHGVELGVVLLHSYNPTDQAAKLLDRGFAAVGAGP
jgi:serine-type D-Ala-D-Ala carboxypeptidase (penicillin-binding protein 5/6)